MALSFLLLQFKMWQSREFEHWSDVSKMQQKPSWSCSWCWQVVLQTDGLCLSSSVSVSRCQRTSSSSFLSSAALSMSLSFFMMRLTDSSWKSAVSYSRAMSPYFSVCSDISRLLLSWGPIMNPLSLHMVSFQPSKLVWWIKTNKDWQPACNKFMKNGMWS